MKPLDLRLRSGRKYTWILALVVALLMVTQVRAQIGNSGYDRLEWDNYWNGRRLSLDVELGLAMLTDAEYTPVDYFPGFGFTVEYYLPYLIGIGFEFQQNQKTGTITLPSKNYGDIEVNGRLTLTAYSLQIKFSSPVIDGRYNIYLETGLGFYIVDLNAETTLTVPYHGRNYTFDYDLNYTIVEYGLNGGLGMDMVFWDTLKVGFLGRIHYIMEQEEETDFGAINVFLRIGYTL